MISKSCDCFLSLGKSGIVATFSNISTTMRYTHLLDCHRLAAIKALDKFEA